jgi:hypothetical protein
MVLSKALDTHDPALKTSIGETPVVPDFQVNCVSPFEQPKFYPVKMPTITAYPDKETAEAAARQPDETPLVIALRRIEKWFGEFPETGRVWGDKTPMPYSACYGSNGERDFMRQIARDALEQHKASPKRESGEPKIKPIYRQVTPEEQAAIDKHWADTINRIKENPTIIKIPPHAKPYCLECGSDKIGYKTDSTDEASK